MTDDETALAMVLGLLPVEGIGDVTPVLIRQGDRRRRRQGDALVGGAVEEVAGQVGGLERGGVEASQPGQGGPGIEEAGVEKVGTVTPGLEGEVAETEDPLVEGETKEFALVILHLAASGRRVRLIGL